MWAEHQTSYNIYVCDNLFFGRKKNQCLCKIFPVATFSNSRPNVRPAQHFEGTIWEQTRYFTFGYGYKCVCRTQIQINLSKVFTMGIKSVAVLQSRLLRYSTCCNHCEIETIPKSKFTTLTNAKKARIKDNPSELSSEECNQLVAWPTRKNEPTKLNYSRGLMKFFC
jgi:hypothetical protein